VPPDLLSSNASQQQKNLLGNIQSMITNVRRDEMEGVIFPMAYDQNKNPLYEFKLLSTGGSRQFDTDKIIQRYDHRIAMTCLADFLLLGQGAGATGSWAMHSDKTKLFSRAIGAFLDIIAETFNRFAIPRLMALNDFQITDNPKIMHGDLQSVDLKELKDYILGLSQAGMPLFPNEELEKYLKTVADLPVDIEEEADIDQQIEPIHRDPPEKITEIPGNPIQTPSGLGIPADTTPVNGKPPVNTATTNELGKFPIKNPPDSRQKPVTNASGNAERTSQMELFNRSQTPEQYDEQPDMWRKQP
jgi:hypothetical protein